jgi:altronate dehydratase
MAGSGANIILFTTGLGTPTGNPITPVIKLSTNTKLANKMPDIIDIDCGAIITGEKTIEQKGAEILDFIIEVASGKIKPKAVALNQDDFIPVETWSISLIIFLLECTVIDCWQNHKALTFLNHNRLSKKI